MAPEWLEFREMTASLFKAFSQSSNPAGFLSSRDEPRAVEQFVRVPQIQGSILQSSGNYTARVLVGFRPRQIIETIVARLLVFRTLPGRRHCCWGPYPESVSILPAGCSSPPASPRSRAKSQSSRHVSLEKLASTAPARVPVATNGEAAPGDQAKVAVRGISLRRTMLKEVGGAAFGIDQGRIKVELHKGKLSTIRGLKRERK